MKPIPTQRDVLLIILASALCLVLGCRKRDGDLNSKVKTVTTKSFQRSFFVFASYPKHEKLSAYDIQLKILHQDTDNPKNSFEKTFQSQREHSQYFFKNVVFPVVPHTPESQDKSPKYYGVSLVFKKRNQSPLVVHNFRMIIPTSYDQSQLEEAFDDFLQDIHFLSFEDVNTPIKVKLEGFKNPKTVSLLYERGYLKTQAVSLASRTGKSIPMPSEREVSSSLVFALEKETLDLPPRLLVYKGDLRKVTRDQVYESLRVTSENRECAQRAFPGGATPLIVLKAGKC